MQDVVSVVKSSVVFDTYQLIFLYFVIFILLRFHIVYYHGKNVNNRKYIFIIGWTKYCGMILIYYSATFNETCGNLHNFVHADIVTAGFKLHPWTCYCRNDSRKDMLCILQSCLSLWTWFIWESSWYFDILPLCAWLDCLGTADSNSDSQKITYCLAN